MTDEWPPMILCSKGAARPATRGKRYSMKTTALPVADKAYRDRNNQGLRG